MRYFKNHISRFVAFLLAIQTLNISIEVSNAQIPAGNKFNYIDTYVEYIAEVVLKYTNAIPESNHRQKNMLQQHRQLEVAFQKIELFTITFCEEKTEIQFLNFSDNYAYQFIRKINPPPPKA